MTESPRLELKVIDYVPGVSLLLMAPRILVQLQGDFPYQVADDDLRAAARLIARERRYRIRNPVVKIERQPLPSRDKVKWAAFADWPIFIRVLAGPESADE